MNYVFPLIVLSQARNQTKPTNSSAHVNFTRSAKKDNSVNRSPLYTSKTLNNVFGTHTKADGAAVSSKQM